MSTLKPFRAFRPTKDKVKEVACRPYDVLNTEEAKQEAEGKPHSFYHVIKPEIDFPADQDPYAEAIYKKGKENFDKLVADGVMRQDNDKCFYIYQLVMNGHTQKGIVGCNAIDEYFNNTIKKHELTRPDKEEDRKNHVRHGKMNAEPVFFSYPAVEAIDSIVETITNSEPEYNFMTDDNIQHTLWVVDKQEDVNSLIQQFKDNVKSIYVADGHHRTAAGALVGKEFRDADKQENPSARYNYFMSVLFPDNQLKIIDYNRVVKDLNGNSPEEFLEKLNGSFDVTEMPDEYKPNQLHSIGMYLEGKWYRLNAKENTYDDNDPIGVLDVTILSKEVLEPILNIHDLRTDKRIDFVGGIRGLGELKKRVDNGEMKVAFAMYPVSMKQLIDIADNDMIMPPKVTWFEPKLRSGLFVHSLGD